MSTVVTKCHACGRALLERTSFFVGTMEYESFRRRQHGAIVLSRRREVLDAPQPNGAIRFREYANTCSLACVRVVAATWPRVSDDDQSALSLSHVYSGCHKVDDEAVVRMWGEMPDEPTDAWFNIDGTPSSDTWEEDARKTNPDARR